ncbi:NAD(P)-dependent alcohol dehydrogenase [Microcoleus sp. FACHB-SPT15]|uniref:NAD(P)-dependent alcohol dehydrogenase n=1 Tax=Microcoleus sp. FACHB-SPT15 TaxID=2692830 RepID=UPI00177CCB7F|nr:NAD(P)-dependent alcohol dehydrogenase [Microcoleus sp. FACHB-SPT15]MBD1807327.1 NAD(P)-dependent alcohol dehydrogenase [Microcoleus sp. FACHB-SPT15]
MKAVTINQYGSASVLNYTDIEQPRIKPEQILVKVQASSVNPVDWKIRSGQLQLLTGYNFPLVLGFDVAGTVVEVGAGVTRFKAGDEIYAYLDSIPGGAYAEYAAVSERAACLLPNNMTYEQAAAVPLAATTALQSLRDLGLIQSGHQVLINGSSGGVGTFAVQIAKALGAEVTAVCSTKNLELMTSLGADHVIDYTNTDITQDTRQYDIILDAVGKQSFSSCQAILKPNGIYVDTLPMPDTLVQGCLTFFLPGKKAKLVIAQSNSKDLGFLKELIETGKMRSLIQQTYPLSEVAAAHTTSEQERVVGKLVITVSH